MVVTFSQASQHLYDVLGKRPERPVVCRCEGGGEYRMEMDELDDGRLRSFCQKCGGPRAPGAGYAQKIAKPIHVSERPCPGFVAAGQCENGHHWGKKSVCGRDWCAYCGGKDGIAHDRRKARWYPKAQQLTTAGRLVITVPPELRHRYRGRYALAGLGRAVRRSLRETHGFKRGLMGWHFFGEHAGVDESPSGVDDATLNPPVYHPHMDIVLDAGYLGPSRLAAIKASVALILKVNVKRVNAYYSYSHDPRKIVHFVNYSCRPTFLCHEWDKMLAHLLKGFRARQAWGVWGDPPAWGLESGDKETPVGAVVVLMAHHCPTCGATIKWVNKPVDDKKYQWADLGAGFYERVGLVTPGPGPPGGGGA